MKNSFLDKLLNRLDRVGSDDLQNYLQQLASEKGFLETIFNTLQEGVLVLDPQGKILYLNPRVQAFLGLRPEQALGDLVARYVKELDWPKILSARQVVTRDLEVFYPEARYLSFYLVPVEAEDKTLRGYAMIFHDLTETRAKTQEVIESEKLNALTLLAAGVAHELGNPLNSLNIHLQLLERDLRKNETGYTPRVRETLEVVRTEVSRLDTIITQFLRAVRPTALVRSVLPLSELIRESVAFLKPEITDRDILVECEFAEEVPDVAMDPGQVKQAFYNIIKNAVQAMRTGGILRITTTRDDTHAVVSFTDNGSGIDPENITRIHDPYFTTKSGGSGLGLVIVNRIVREHGGMLEVDSHLGQGTTVRLFFPLDERRVRLLPARTTPEAG
jgi:PAS domain S-box-containing protein